MSPEENQGRSYIKFPRWTWPLFLAGAAALYYTGGCLERNHYSVPTCGRIVDTNCDGKPDRVEIKREFQRREGGHDVLMIMKDGYLVPIPSVSGLEGKTK